MNTDSSETNPCTTVDIETAIRNAEASLNMEGMHPSPETLDDCRRVLRGEISHEEYISSVRERYRETE